MVSIAGGNISIAIAKVEESMARAIPIVLAFLAQFLGLGNIAEGIQKALAKIRKPIDKIVDKIVKWIADKAKKIIAKIGKKLGGKGKKDKNKENGDFSYSTPIKVDGGHTLRYEGDKAPDDILAIYSKRVNLNTLLQTKQEEVHQEKNPTKQKAMEQLMDRIAAHLDIIGVNISDTTLIPTKVRYTMEQGKAAHVIAEPLTMIPGNTAGSSPGNTPVKGWEKIPTQERRDYWVRAHLLNDKLHGPGKDWNLFPAHKTINTQMEKDVESKAKEAIKQKGSYYYDAQLSYGGSEFPNGLSITFGVYDINSSTRTSVIAEPTYTLDPPKELYTVSLNTDSAARLNEVALLQGISGMSSFFEKIVKERKDNGVYDDLNELSDRIAPSFKNQKDFDKKYDQLFDLVFDKNLIRIK